MGKNEWMGEVGVPMDKGGGGLGGKTSEKICGWI